MKKLTLILALVSVLQMVNAQVATEPETPYDNKSILGGSFIFFTSENGLFYISPGTYTGSDDSKVTAFGISPYYGREVNPNLILGGKFNYLNTKEESESSFPGSPDIHWKTNSNMFGVGIFSRYTFNPEDKANLFIEPFINYNKRTSKQKRESTLIRKEEINFIELGTYVGALYNISSKMRINLKIGAINYVNGSKEITSEDGDRDKNTDFSHFVTAINLTNVFFGFEIAL